MTKKNQKLIALREGAGLSVAEMASLMKMSYQNYHRLERGRRPPTAIHTQLFMYNIFIAKNGLEAEYREWAKNNSDKP